MQRSSEPRGPVRYPLAERGLHWRGVPTTGAGTVVQVSTAHPVTQRIAPHNWMLYLFIFLLPLQNIQSGYLPSFGGGLNFLNIGFLLSLAYALAFTRGKLARDEPLNWILLGYMLYAVVSYVIGSQLVSGSNRINILKDHLIAVSICYLVQMSVSDWSHAKRVVIATLLPLPYIARVTWAQYVANSRWHFSDDSRVRGTFALLGSNEFGGFCVTMAAMCFALLVATRMPRKYKILAAAGLAAAGLGILYSYSRTAYIAVVLALVVVLLAWRGRWKLIPLFIAIGLALPVILPPSVIERYQSTHVEEGKQDESTRMRMVFWGIAWDTYLSHPVTGTGLATFANRVNPYHMDTHNLYMRTLAEGGTLGAVSLLTVLLSTLSLARRRLRAAPAASWQYGLALGLLGAWTGLIIGNVFGDRFTYYPVIGYFWVYVGILVKAKSLPPEAPGAGL